jgi:energy-coupling factor transporter ATP-binding protein EcfA2
LIERLHIKHFKSIHEVTIDTPLITLFLGPNGTGKSSVIQALGVLKNFLLNSNRPVEELFNLGYVRLGSLQDVVSQHAEGRAISISTDFKGEVSSAKHTLTLATPKSGSRWQSLEPLTDIDLEVEFPIPYAQNQQAPLTLRGPSGENWNLIWNGITLTATITLGPRTTDLGTALSELPTLHTNAILSIFIVPTSGAFFNTIYSIVGLPEKRTLLTIPESILPSILHQDPDLEERLSYYMEQIFAVRNVRARITYPNTSLVVGRRKIVSNIVNEGQGLNRAAYLLATTLAVPSGALLAIEEPENHLHPQAQSKTADILVRIVKDEKKQLLISTHSEHLLLGFLSAVARGDLAPKDISIYFTALDQAEMRTTFEKAEINDKGQIKGGLRDFFESDVQALSEALKNLGGKSGRNSS